MGAHDHFAEACGWNPPAGFEKTCGPGDCHDGDEDEENEHRGDHQEDEHEHKNNGDEGAEKCFARCKAEHSKELADVCKGDGDEDDYFAENCAHLLPDQHCEFFLNPRCGRVFLHHCHNSKHADKDKCDKIVAESNDCAGVDFVYVVSGGTQMTPLWAEFAMVAIGVAMGAAGIL